MPADQEATELLLQVVLPQDVARAIRGGSKYAVPTARLINLRLRVRVLSGPVPPSITLQNLRLWSQAYNNTYPEHLVALDAGGHAEVELVGGAVLPFAGLFWLEALVKVPGFNIETKQLTLQDQVGQGWFLHDQEPAEVMLMDWYKRRWRSPVIAVDVLALIQARLNTTILRLTIFVAFVAVAQLIAAVWPLLSAIRPSVEHSVMQSRAPLSRTAFPASRPPLGDGSLDEVHEFSRRRAPEPDH